MQKIYISLLLLFLGKNAIAQFDYGNRVDDVPVLGKQYGIVTGGYTAMLPNRDDLNADQRLDPQMMNFNYGGGFDYVYWFQKTIGFGGQMLFWKGGAKYTGKDTITKYELDAKTSISYLKIPLLFHFKSFNRYYPNRRVRFNAYFGPYVALMSGYNDKLKLYHADSKTTLTSETSGFNINSKTSVDGNTTQEGSSKVDGLMYNLFDVGFVTAVGTEIRIGKRNILAMHIRGDWGISNVENNKGLKLKIKNSDGSYGSEQDFKFWDGYYAKYNKPNGLDKLAGWVSNRPSTHNFSIGVFLSYRRYF